MNTLLECMECVYVCEYIHNTTIYNTPKQHDWFRDELSIQHRNIYSYTIIVLLTWCIRLSISKKE